MRPIFLLFAVVLLSACGTDAKQSIALEDFNTERPELHMITHKNIHLDASIEYKDQIAALNAEAPSEGADGETHADGARAYSTEEVKEIDKVIQQAEDIQQDVSGVWTETFTPMYNQFLWHGVDNDDVAANLEEMHESYGELEMQVDTLTTPAFLAPEDEMVLEQAKADLYLAISNRTLALIEFKQMNQNEDYAMNETMLDIHLQNSTKYLSSASHSLSQLETSTGDAGSDEEWVVADE